MFLSVSRSNNWRMSEPPEPSDNREFQLMRDEFLNEASYTCSCCGYKTDKYQHVHHVDGDHAHNEYSNFSCRCPLCHMTEHLGYVSDNKMGVLVFCPSLTQAELNAFVRIAWVTRYMAQTCTDYENNQTLFEVARKTGLWVDMLKSTTIQVGEVYKLSSLRALAEVLRSMNDAEYELREKQFPHLRLLFTPENFSREIQYWATDSNFTGMNHPNNWPDLAKHQIELKNK